MIDPRTQPCDEGEILAVPCAGATPRVEKPWVLAATILGSSIAFIDGSVVNIALPAIRTDLDASVASIQWVINAYTLCLAALLLIGGAAGDRFGRRRMFATGVAVFTFASIWCGLAPDIVHLVVARAAQGIGAALLIPNSLAIIGATFDESERGKAIGTWAGVAALGTAAGPVLGGWLVDSASWRMIFAINPIVAIPTLWIAWRHVPESRESGADAPLDLGGAALAFMGLGVVTYGLIALPNGGWRSVETFAPLIAGLVLLAFFLRRESRNAAPMMPLTLFRSRAFSGVNALTLLLYAALSGAFFLLPFDLIYVQGFSATLTGAFFLPFTLILGFLSRRFGGLHDRFGARLPLTAGPIVVAFGYGLLALPVSADAAWLVVVAMAVVGLGMAIAVAPLTTVVLNAVPHDRTGVASGINNAVARTAGLIAVALFGAIALASFNAALDRRAEALDAPPAIIAAVKSIGGDFAAHAPPEIADPQQRRLADAAIRESLAGGIRLAMAFAAALALAGALVGALTIAPRRTAPEHPPGPDG